MSATTVRSPQTLGVARIYAIREIARRAGVTPDFFQSWQFETDGGWMIVRIGPSASQKIRFPIARTGDPEVLPPLLRRATRASWAYAPERAILQGIPDFVVPYVEQEQNALGPIFCRRGDGSIDFQFDLPTAALWTLSRREEEVFPARDVHGRFPANASVAMEFDFLHRPIVDEYGFAVEQALNCLLPRWQPCPRELRVMLSHCIDDVGIPFAPRTTLGHTLRRRNPAASINDFFSILSGGNPSYLSMIEKLAFLSREHRLDSAFYWKASSAGPFDTGYDLRDPKIQKVVRRLLDQGIECGAHPGYDTFASPERLQFEVDILSEAIGRHPMGGQQHFLRWKPDTWRHWEACGLAYDNTVGYADRLGFRAGTCIPYHPWIFSENRESNLLEIPVIVMDCTPRLYMGLSIDASFEAILEYVRRCRMAGGVFTLVWHNTTLMDPRFGNLYVRLLKVLSGTKRFERLSATAGYTTV